MKKNKIEGEIYMRNLWGALVLLLCSAIILSACSEDKNEEKEVSKEELEPSEESKEKESDPVEDDQVEDQLDLEIGDTGVFDTTLGTYEISLDTAELKGKEFEGVQSTRDDIILLDLTVRNTGDETLIIDEIIESMEIADDLDGAGSGDNGIGFDTIEALEGAIEPGEEMTGNFLTTVNESDTYYFRKNPGNVEAGTSNQVIWTIKKEDIE